LGHAAWWLAPLAALIGQYVMGLPVIRKRRDGGTWRRVGLL
jgi:hypothetical protein